MADTLGIDQAKELIPQLPTVTSFILYFLLFIFAIIIISVIAYFVVMKKKFNKKVIIFEKVNGRFEPNVKDRGMLMRYGTGGDQVFYLKKLKKYLPVPELQTGRNTFWFFLRQDGELINFTPRDFDEQSRTMGAKFLDKEMRYARVSLQSHWKERYDKPKFWEKYGGLIVNLMAILIVMIFLFLIIDKIFDSLSKVESLIKTANEVQQTDLRVLSALDNICSQSGIVVT